MPDIKQWTLTEMVEQWQKCMGQDDGCLVTKCPLNRKVLLELDGSSLDAEASISFQGCSLVGKLDELVKAGWSRKPWKEESG